MNTATTLSRSTPNCGAANRRTDSAPAALLLLLLCHSAVLAHPGHHVPPPGLYRVDLIDGSMGSGASGPSMRIVTEGEHGDSSMEQKNGKQSVTRYSSGQGATTLCISPPKPGSAAAGFIAGGCQSGPGQVTENSVIYHGSCDGSQFTSTITKTGANSYRIESEMVLGTINGASTDKEVSRMKHHGRYLVEHGTTVEERAAGAEILAQLPAFSRDMAEAAKLSGGVATPGLNQMKTVSSMTKIADSCAGQNGQ